MALWFHTLPLEQLNAMNAGTINERLGVEWLELGDDVLRARMPVDERTHQPFGILHGGASVVLAESLGSLAAWLAVDPSKFICVGLEVNANHLRPVKGGWVVGAARPIHLGRTIHVWDIRIENEDGKPVCISRLTVAVRPIQGE